MKKVAVKKTFDAILQRRITIVLLFFFAALVTLLGRLFLLQIVQHQYYLTLASKQQRVRGELTSERGEIFAHTRTGDLVPFALNKTYKTIAISPRAVKKPKELAEILAKLLDLSREEVTKKIDKKEDPYEVILRKVDPKQAEKVISLAHEGVLLENERWRVYPHEEVGAHLIGFVSKEEDRAMGRYGIERFYDKELSGEKGFFEGVKDAAGFFIALGKRIVNPPRNGARVILTLDYNIQLKADEVLRKTYERWQAVSGSILVVDPKTGRILADTSQPTFDPNEFAKEKDFSVFLNPIIESQYEFGSVIKPITMAGGLEERVVRSDTTYTDPGEIRIGGYTIRNFDERSYGLQTMTQVLEKSLNTGAVYVARLLGGERQRKYLERFGFGTKTGIDLPGEVGGSIGNMKSGREIDHATASFGQGIAVTPIQLAMAIGAIANEGKLMHPYAVEKIVDDSGNEIKNEPKVVRQVITQETAETLTKMLVSAVKNGFENRAGVKGYFVAGKTGTAQIPRSDGRGYSDNVIHTFVGYAPAFNPRFLVLLQLNEPKGNRFAANTLTPAFHDLAEFILNYYEVPPDEK